MSGLLSKFKYFIGLEDADEEYVDEYEYEYEDESIDVEELYNEGYRAGSQDYSKVEEGELEVQEGTNSNRKSNIVELHSNSNMIVVVHEPKSYDEAPKIVDDLKARKVGVINFEGLEIDLKRQIFDFINGALYAMEGKIQKVTKDIFIVAPKHVEIDGITDELRNNGMFNWSF